MDEMEINDCWSLIAVVKECAQKVKLARLTTESTLTPKTTTATATATATTTIATTTKLNPFKSRKTHVDQYVLTNNTNGFVLPFAAGAVNNTAPAADGSSSKDELKDMDIPYQVPNNHHGPIFGGTYETPLVQTSGVPSSLEHLRLQNFHKQGPCDVGVNDQCIHKKKKFEDRWMVRFTSEELAKNDKWAWRKYGQKPIKGSPYPRNYYRCSSMKGCKARKQVERSPMAPNLYVVTYTSHHHHPCPPVRNANGSRVKFTAGSDTYPQPKMESPTSIVPDRIRPWYGSGLGFHEAKIEHEELVDEVSSGANAESFGSGESINNSNSYDYEILIPNLMADSDLLTGMDRLSGSDVKSISSGCSTHLLQ